MDVEQELSNRQAGVPVALTPLGELYLSWKGWSIDAERERLEKRSPKVEAELASG